jgi:acyl carrier protein
VLFRSVVLKINDFLFCHGGIKKSIINLFEQYNKNFEYINELWYRYFMNISINEIDEYFIDKLFIDSESILFVKSKDNYEDEKYVLDSLKSKKIIVGHKQQYNIILSDNTIYTDMLLETAFNEKRYQYLDIIDNNIVIKSIQYK